MRRENARKRPLDRAEVPLLGLELRADLEMHLASNGYVGLGRVEQEKINVCGLFRLDPNYSGKGMETLGRYLSVGGLDDLAGRIFGARVDEKSFLGVAGFRLGWQEPRDGIMRTGRRLRDDPALHR